MKAKSKEFQKLKYSYDDPNGKKGKRKDGDYISFADENYCLFCHSTENVRKVNGNNMCYSCFCYLKTAVDLNGRKAYESK